MVDAAARWPIHVALAWVLTRDQIFTEAALANDFSPHLSSNDWKSFDEVDVAWTALFSAIIKNRIALWGLAYDASNQCPSPPRRITKKLLEGLDWESNGESPRLAPAYVEKQSERTGGFGVLEVDRAQVLSEFPIGSSPLARSTARLGSPQSPTGGGYMALSAAAYWIATEGGAKSFFIREITAWRRGYEILVTQITNGDIVAIGRQNGERAPVPIDGYNFSGLRIRYPFQTRPADPPFETAPHLDCAGPAAPTDWEAKYNDRLLRKNGEVEFSHIEVRKLDVLKVWPFHAVPTTGRTPAAFDIIPDQPLKAQIRESARRALLLKYPNGMIPKTTSTQTLVNEIASTLSKGGITGGVSADTVARVIGRKR